MNGEYIIIKLDRNGVAYHVVVFSNLELIQHLSGTFSATDHIVLSVTRISTECEDA